MDPKIVKIDRVKSQNEAIKFQDLGCSLIGASLSREGLQDDGRFISIDVAMGIRKILNKSKFVLELNSQNYNLYNFSEIMKIGADYIQLDDNRLPPSEFVDILIDQNIKIIWSGISASYDDDPSWLLSRCNDYKNLHPYYCQIDLLPDVVESWSFFKTESPNYPEELQIDDINNLGEKYPLLITTNFCVSNIKEIISSFGTIKGINLTLGSNLTNGNMHYFDYDLAVQIVGSLS